MVYTDRRQAMDQLFDIFRGDGVGEQIFDDTTTIEYGFHRTTGEGLEMHSYRCMFCNKETDINVASMTSGKIAFSFSDPCSCEE